MVVRADVLLDKSAEHIAGIRTMYATLVSEVAVTDDLLYLVRSAIQDQLSALDWIATAVDQEHGKAADRSPYFPLRDAPQAFAKQFDRDFALVAASRPDIKEVFERHQPYQADHEVLAHIHDLARVNKHQDFTPQERKERQFMGLFINGQCLVALGMGGGIGLSIGALPPIVGQLVNQQAASDPSGQAQAITATVIDWHFSICDRSHTGLLSHPTTTHSVCRNFPKEAEWSIHPHITALMGG